jgi:Flp pilus assembly pilin Flp
MKQNLWSRQEGQDVAEYAIILAVVVLLVVGTVRIMGLSPTNIFSTVDSSIAQ